MSNAILSQLMRLSKTTEYAIRVLVYMAAKDRELYSVTHLSKHLRIPYKYLARLMTRLGQAGFLKATQGKKGGYTIFRPLDEIFIYQIVKVVEGLENYHRCVLGYPECSDSDPCPMHHLWEEHLLGIRKMIYDHTLADLDFTVRMSGV